MDCASRMRPSSSATVLILHANLLSRAHTSSEIGSTMSGPIRCVCALHVIVLRRGNAIRRGVCVSFNRVPRARYCEVFGIAQGRAGGVCLVTGRRGTSASLRRRLRALAANGAAFTDVISGFIFVPSCGGPVPVDSMCSIPIGTRGLMRHRFCLMHTTAGFTFHFAGGHGDGIDVSTVRVSSVTKTACLVPRGQRPLFVSFSSRSLC